MDTVKVAPLSSESELCELLVTTVDSVRVDMLLGLLMAARVPMLLVGPTGTGGIHGICIC